MQANALQKVASTLKALQVWSQEGEANRVVSWAMTSYRRCVALLVRHADRPVGASEPGPGSVFSCKTRSGTQGGIMGEEWVT